MQRNKLGDAIAISNLKLSITHWPTDREMLGDAIAPKNTFNTEWHIFSHLPHTKPKPPLLSVKIVTNSCHGEMFWRFGEIFWCFGAMVKCFDLFSQLLQLVPQLRICQSSPSHLELFSDGPAAPNSLSLQDTSLDSMNQVCSYQFHFYIKRKVFLKVGLKSTFHTHTHPNPTPPHPLPHPKDSQLLSIFAACAKWWQLRWGSYIVCGCHRRTSATLISALSPLHWQKAQLQQQNVLLVANWKSWNCIRIAKQRELGHYETAVVSQRNGKLTYFFADFLQSNICSGVPKMTNIR